MVSDDGTILRDGENELNESPAGSGNATIPIGTAMPSASGRESEPLGEGDDPLGNGSAVPNAANVVMGGGAGGDGDRQEPDGTDGTDGGGV